MKRVAKYVCAFRGRRDNYQVPLALAEIDLLDKFITDAYSGQFVRRMCPWLPQRIQAKVRFRHEQDLSDDRVKCLWGTTIIEQLRHQAGFDRWTTFGKLDARISLAAAAHARRMRSNLLLYHSYAWEAFTARYSHSPRKVLFQYHPHLDLENRLLAEDSVRYPGYYSNRQGGPHLSEPLKHRDRDAWRHADLILCASTFTKNSLIATGAEPATCKVVPYGIDIQCTSLQWSESDSFEVLFVGSGTQRKGLHHLLLAWQKAALPTQSRLTLVCRSIDPTLEDLARRTSRVRLVRGLSDGQLNHHYKTSALFAMPSLVEGFGQVYLEALALGCPVLGTFNTCLPDLGESDAIFQVEPGRIEQLISELERLARLLPGNLNVRKKAYSCATNWSWAKFRQGIQTEL